MRVAHVITRMIVGGAQENTLLNCQDLIRHHGDDVLLISGPALGPEGDLLRQQEGQGGTHVPVKYIPSLRRAIHPWRDWSSYRAIKRALREFAPDVVHTHSAKGGLLGRLAAWSLGTPAVIHTVHGAPFHPYQGFLPRRVFRACEKYAARRCHKLVSVADAMTDLLVEAGVADREKFVTVYSGMDVEPFVRAGRQREAVRKQLGLAADEVVIGKIARLFPLKGHEYLTAAAETVVKRCPQVRFLLVGDGILREKIEADLEARQLTSYFRFVGLVPPKQIPGLVAAMDGLVHTSLREGLARALPQALIAGKPVVSFDVDGAREVVIDDETGFLVPPKDSAALAEAVVKMVEDADLRQRLGATGRARFTEQFRHENMTAQLRRLYEQVLAGGANE